MAYLFLHTPGYWLVRPVPNNDRDYRVLNADGDCLTRNPHSKEYNARLIAAAPLLAEIVAAIAEFPLSNETPDGWNDDHLDETIIAARAALERLQ